MGSLPSDTLAVEMADTHVLAGAGDGAETTEWLLNSPNPPSFWEELAAAVRENVIPRSCTKTHLAKKKTKTTSSSDEKQSIFKATLILLQSMFPILKLGRNYKASNFKSDIMAGLTLASLSIPQSIGYANLAKLDPQFGLYTSAVPPLIYALMGSSREIAIGPVAVVSLLLSSMLQEIRDPVADPVGYRSLVFTVTLFAGIFQAGFGLLRLGFLVDFLSHAAIVGFMAGAAILIGLQQLKGLLAISNFTTKTDVVSVLESVVRSAHQPWYPLNIVLGCSFLIFLLVARFIGRRKKKLFWVSAIAPLISVILSTLIVFVSRADRHGVKIVKEVKEGLNPISVHQLQFNSSGVGLAAKSGLIAAIIALTEAMAVGRSFASIKGYNIDGNREMIAMGFMNIIGSLTSCYVATGSFSRTAVNFSAGCESVLSNIVMAITVMLALQFFTRLLYFTPMAILASIILSALPGLIDINEALRIWKLDKLDFLACLGAFLGVLFHSVEFGLLLAVGISFAKILLISMRPAIEEVGRLGRSDMFGNMKQFPMAMKTQGISIVRINSSLLCFANASFIKDRIMRLVEEDDEDDDIEETTKDQPKQLVVDMCNVMNIDTSGIIVLEELHKRLLLNGIQVTIASPKWEVIHKLKRTNFVERIEGRVFLSVGEAVDSCLQNASKLPSSTKVLVT
ncbi:low affinity sulfate transporter 3-like [Cucurbita pepo subsp. pepo]|uniref:low affinity sulfate transporter 3-like n=1 Tax=Cucurbita pepo subsp. pepo TaxID=3664 RepID=UPI000C9D4C07|nr:low affinity sulfate transporter 3-like [Cucurbita pepo subsp. pepo]